MKGDINVFYYCVGIGLLKRYGIIYYIRKYDSWCIFVGYISDVIFYVLVKELWGNCLIFCVKGGIEFNLVCGFFF